MRRSPRLLAAVLGLVLAVGLPATPAAAKGKKGTIVPSGVLGDYSDLEPHPDKKDVLVYRKREGVLRDYDRFIVDPPLVYFHAEAGGSGVAPDEIKMLADFLYDELVAAITESEFYQVTEETGPRVAHLRVAITDVVPVDPEKNIAAKAAGIAVGVGFLVPRVDLGRASIEAEILDSLSGERLVAVVATRRPHRFGGVIKGSKEWGDVKAAFKSWAKSFRRRLDEIHRPDEASPAPDPAGDAPPGQPGR